MDTHISIRDLSVEFRVYGAHGRSLKRRIFSQMSGGEVSAGEGDSITVKALNHVSLEISHGDRVGLVGHNGSGKSTLIKILSGFHSPDPGSGPATLDGRELRFGDPDGVQAAGIRFIHQDLGLADGLSILDNLKLGSGLYRTAPGWRIRWRDEREDARRRLAELDPVPPP